MSVFTSRPALRWLVPAAAAVAVIGGGAALGTLAAAAEPSLPPRTAAQLLVDLQTARLDGLSGTVVQRADLGLPELPALAGQASELSGLIGGTNTLRVWYSGPDKARIALLNTLGETDVIRNGRDTWVWESRGNTASHYVLPEGAGRPAAAGEPLPGVPHSPQEAAEQALGAIEPTTEVTTGTNARVAGRDAYELVLSPRDKSSLLGQVRLAIDATEHVPLRVEVYPSGADEPAFKVAFTQISFGRPDPERFRFNPPPGADVQEKSTGEAPGQIPGDKAGAKPDAKAAKDARENSTVVGEGWTSVFVTRMSEDAAAGGAGTGGDAKKADADERRAEEALLGQLPKVSGEWGSGRVLRSKLFTALLTDDGRLLVGAVTPERLYEVAGSPAARLN